MLFQKAPPEQAVTELKEKIEILEAILGNQKFFAGDTATIADISLGAGIPILKVLYPGLMSVKLQSWYDRVLRDIPELDEINDQYDYKPLLQQK